MSPMAAVWSEREPGGWHDCWVSAVLMPLVYAGFARFPLGAFTDAEREALERSQTRYAPEKGGDLIAADEATAKRYGLTMHKLTTDLATALNQPGHALAVLGLNARLPTRLRHWDPGFAGVHAATVVTRATTDPLWLDPEAPMGYGGDPITDAELLHWAYGAHAARYLAAGELAPSLAGYRVRVGPGTRTVYQVERYTHRLTRSREVTFGRASVAPVARGAPGFWMTTAGGLSGWYYVAGKSGAFTIQRLERYPDGTLRATTISPTSR